MLIPPGYAAISVELHQILLARSAYVTWGCRIDGGIPVDTVASRTLTAVSNITTGHIGKEIDASVVFSSCTARIGQDGGDPIVYVATGSVSGGGVGTAAPPNVAVLTRKRTARGGRRGRGRIYWPWTTTATSIAEQGVISGSDVTRLQTAATTLLADLAAANVPMCILHNESEPGIDHPTAPGAPDQVTLLQVDPVVGTQRRRLGR